MCWLLDSVGMALRASIHVRAPLEQFNITVYCIAKEFFTGSQNLFSVKLGFELTDMGVQKWEERGLNGEGDKSPRFVITDPL